GAFYLNSLQMKHLSDKGRILDSKILCLEVGNTSTIWAGEEDGKALNFSINKRLDYFQIPVFPIADIHAGLIPKTILISAGDLKKIRTQNMVFYRQNGVRFIAIQAISDMLHLNGEWIVGKSGGIFRLDFKKKQEERISNAFFRVSSLVSNNNDIL